MAAITIDGKGYDVESLSDEARAQISSLRVVDQELNHLQSKIAMTQTARNAYARSLTSQLPEKADSNAEQVIKVDGDAYSIAALSEEAKSLLASVKMADQKLDQLQVELAVTQTARNAYAKALQGVL